MKALDGEAFEQLYLSKIQNETLAVGLIATLETFQLIASEDISNRQLAATEAKEFFEQKKAKLALRARAEKECASELAKVNEVLEASGY